MYFLLSSFICQNVAVWMLFKISRTFSFKKQHINMDNMSFTIPLDVQLLFIVRLILPVCYKLLKVNR